MLMPSPYHEEHDGYLAHYLQTGVAKIMGAGREVRAQRADGATFPVHLAVGEMTVNGERKFTGILHDLSARVRMEQQLREQAAMVHLGEMAAVIAHEVKNPLAGIRGAVQVIGSRLRPDSRDAAVAGEIVKRIDGLNDLMKDLLLFARPPQPKPVEVDVAALVSSTASLCRCAPLVRASPTRVRAPTAEASAAPALGNSTMAEINDVDGCRRAYWPDMRNFGDDCRKPALPTACQTKRCDGYLVF